MRRRGGACLAACLACLAPACAPAVPDPRAALTAYAAAAARGDADAIYGMMTEAARAALSRDEVRRRVADERAELADEAAAVASKDAALHSRARLRFGDGEEATLDLEGGRFVVASAGALPGGSATPEEALDELRRVVARRSYAGLVRVLAPSTRAALEHDLRALVTGLEHPDTLEVVTHGDEASANVPGGHHVTLQKEGGLWRVLDFD